MPKEGYEQQQHHKHAQMGSRKDETSLPRNPKTPSVQAAPCTSISIDTMKEIFRKWDGEFWMRLRNKFPNPLKIHRRNVYLDVPKVSFCKISRGKFT